MKQHLSVIGMLLIFSTGFGQGQKPMQGAYRMTKQVVNNGTTDSVTGISQAKLFTDRYMVYVHALPGDSLAAYGIGTYKPVDGGIMEYVFYTSEGGAHLDTFKLNVTQTPDGFVQVINFSPASDTNFVLTEYYINNGKAMSSPLDGAWKQTKMEYTPKNGMPQTNTNPVQFKIFQSGNFVWVNTYTDSATQKPASAFGYGTFEMNGQNEVTETNTHSTYASQLVGKPVTLKIDLTGKDAYKQTMLLPDGSKQVEFYERLK
jgi:hypothetical protein